ncbi:CoA transferase [Cupriavidus taiwanensis]|uniref:Putative formyl-coenzyme A transferase, CaiB/BaiF family n=1 Tax=Cupriavidus taiwanensis TaxID=164546 RepID=A0A375IDP4_9BURK|nr:CoA transferase [Cupriavidus taiwanensis]SOY48478.1 putative formyl-coenzyme A transferase, CaiB/BaiF family [Cupriavidus taiwanensis]SOY48589.1 putative formyl-coenzyme A transferase, CaiB/BaiF family [Cupriavidus taiwanensis]SOY83119.1 putative formyl-coenzyme A transferase, CaiB/BaiF family [Cupriavidus taiwanensis]SOZ23111.1 putative formyl-coenzyme A transferase, CaiB/BaiF family [Cupriavidus taiwanensis]SOZ56383.1 putative formyl-coenzyme A transferase, CaiB/BaiF family [Cupriavidus t
MNAPTAAAQVPPMPLDVVGALWRDAGLPDAALAHLRLHGAEPVLPSSFAVGTAAQASLAAAALAAATLWQGRSGRWQEVSVDMRHAITEFRSERYLRVDGGPAPELWDQIAGIYRCGDGRWVRLHTNFPHHRDGVLRLLGCAYDKAAVQAALEKWEAEAFETAASDAGLVVAALRSFDEWDRHPQAAALRGLAPVTLERIGDAPPQPLPAPGCVDAQPLSGVRVLDFTRIIAGPVAGRTLAAHGADVLLVTAPHLPSIAPLVIDTGRGKRSCQLDLRDADDKRTLHKLLHGADVMVQGYRPGGLAELGAGPEAAARARPGMVYVSLSAYGHVGPWASKRGFDSLVQTATGFNHAEAQAAGSDTPRPLPAQVLDHAAGYLLAFGAMAALHRRAVEGGSWHVRVSLAQVGQWLRGLGRVPDGLKAPEQKIDDVADLLEAVPSGFGMLTAVRHAAHLSETPARWTLPSEPLGTHAPEWLPR